MRISGALAIAALLVGSALGEAEAAPSSSDKQRAAQSFQIGKAAYARGDFRDAAAAFEQAAFYAPHPATMLNAAESWELAENPARAAQLYDRVLESSILEAQHQQVATRQLAKLEKKIGTLVVKAKALARIDVDDHEEPSAKIRVAPGPHRLKMTGADGESRTQTVVVGAGETKDVDFLSEPGDASVTPPSKKSEPAPSSGPPIGTWVAFGATVVAGGAAVIFGVRTLDAKSSFDAKPTIASRDDFNSARLATDIALGVAVVAAAAGVVLWLVSTPEPRARKAGTILSWQGGLLW